MESPTTWPPLYVFGWVHHVYWASSVLPQCSMTEFQYQKWRTLNPEEDICFKKSNDVLLNTACREVDTSDIESTTFSFFLSSQVQEKLHLQEQRHGPKHQGFKERRLNREAQNFWNLDSTNHDSTRHCHVSLFYSVLVRHLWSTMEK